MRFPGTANERAPREEAGREFRFGPVPLEEAVGKVLGHNVAGADGRPALRKGRPLSPEDVALLRQLGRQVVYVAEPGAGDLDEDAAARRVAQAALGPGLRLVGPGAGRANLLATGRGVLRVDAQHLLRLNQLEGITVATLLGHTPVRAGQVVATVKVMRFRAPAALAPRGAGGHHPDGRLRPARGRGRGKGARGRAAPRGRRRGRPDRAGR